MTVEQLAKKLDEIIPQNLSEPWDNDGRMVIPCPTAEVTRVLCALDCTTEAINAARVWGCNVIVTHHPLVFKPMGNVLPTDSVGKRVISCIKNNIAVLSYHTRLDSMDGGVNDTLAKLVGLNNITSFLPYGRIGDISQRCFDNFAQSVAEKLQIDPCEMQLVASNSFTNRVALVSGCGKDEINAAIAAGADTFITGEVMHNHMIDCKELGLNLICATHYATERIVLPVLADIIENAGVKSEIFMFKPSQEFGFPYTSAVIDDEE